MLDAVASARSRPWRSLRVETGAQAWRSRLRVEDEVLPLLGARRSTVGARTRRAQHRRGEMVGALLDVAAATVVLGDTGSTASQRSRQGSWRRGRRGGARPPGCMASRSRVRLGGGRRGRESVRRRGGRGRVGVVEWPQRLPRWRGRGSAWLQFADKAASAASSEPRSAWRRGGSTGARRRGMELRVVVEARARRVAATTCGRRRRGVGARRGEMTRMAAPWRAGQGGSRFIGHARARVRDGRR